MMRVAILKTGSPPGELERRFGSYPDMFEDLLAGDGHSFRAWDVEAGIFPQPGGFDALLITGSSNGAYDPLPWIGQLKDFLRAHEAVPMVGICFGHQIMAEAFGGKVEKSPSGWGVGLHHYDVPHRAPWMEGAAGFAISASHQDQVAVQPPHSVVVAASAFTPFAGLAYADKPAISFQGHPEFDAAFATALIEDQRGAAFGEAQADAAVASLKAPDDRRGVGRWIGNFLADVT